jgi:hypothetical protein
MPYVEAKSKYRDKVGFMQFRDFRKTFQVKFSVSKNHYVIARLAEPPKFSNQIFAVINDEEEITVIAKEGTELQSVSEEKSFRRITFEVNLPFNLTGFLSHIFTLLTHKNIPIFAISAYSTDHLFVREASLDEVIELLQKDDMYRLDASR